MPTIPAELSAHLGSLPAVPNKRLASLFDWGMVKVLDQFIDAAGVESIVLTAQAAYDQYIAPLDVPWVPDMLEPTLVDRPAKSMIAAVIRGFHDLVHQQAVAGAGFGAGTKGVAGAAPARVWIGAAA